MSFGYTVMIGGWSGSTWRWTIASVLEPAARVRVACTVAADPVAFRVCWPGFRLSGPATDLAAAPAATTVPSTARSMVAASTPWMTYSVAVPEAATVPTAALAPTRALAARQAVAPAAASRRRKDAALMATPQVRSGSPSRRPGGRLGPDDRPRGALWPRTYDVFLPLGVVRPTLLTHTRHVYDAGDAMSRSRKLKKAARPTADHGRGERPAMPLAPANPPQAEPEPLEAVAVSSDAGQAAEPQGSPSWPVPVPPEPASPNPRRRRVRIVALAVLAPTAFILGMVVPLIALTHHEQESQPHPAAVASSRQPTEPASPSAAPTVQPQHDTVSLTGLGQTRPGIHVQAQIARRGTSRWSSRSGSRAHSPS